MMDSRHGIEGMGQIAHAAIHRRLHLFIGSRRMTNGKNDTQFLCQSKIFLCFRQLGSKRD